MIDFAYLHFKGETTSPWHPGKMKYNDYLYCRDDLLWGRGVRGPILRQLWRSYCWKSDLREGVNFVPKKDCSDCKDAVDCPFNNLWGTDDEGEFKDKPRLIITNLRFLGDVKRGRLALATLDDKNLSAVEGKAPVFVEFIPEGVKFEFEAILMTDGVKFVDEFESAAKISLRFHGWGGLCNEGFGRGLLDVEKRDFDGFQKFIEPHVERVHEQLSNKLSLTFTIEPLLILDRDDGGYYTSIFEEGFKAKLSNSLNERYWQFNDEHVYLQSKLDAVSGLTRDMKIHGWSQKLRKQMVFRGIGNELVLRFSDKLSDEEEKALVLARYGIGRFKNQGFGSLRLKEGGSSLVR